MEKEVQQLREDKENLKLQVEKKQVEVCSKIDI